MEADKKTFIEIDTFISKVETLINQGISEITENGSIGKSSVSCPLKPSDSTPLKHSTMPP